MPIHYFRLNWSSPAPASPTHPTSTSPQPPPTPPTPWVWTCHRCHRTYALAATRRCLSCSHRTCAAGSTAVYCRSAFDYSGWREHNDWRREQAAYLAEPAAWRKPTLCGVASIMHSRAERRVKREEEATARKEKRDRARLRRMRDRTHNCWVDCDYPSHCHNMRYDAQVRRIEGLLSSSSSDDDEPDEVVTPPSSGDEQDDPVEKPDSSTNEEPIEENGWSDSVWTGWGDSSSDSSDTLEEVSDEERQAELDGLAKLTRMD